MKKTQLAICILLSLVSASFADVNVTINSASINYVTNQITITGSGFCANRKLPVVVFNKVALIDVFIGFFPVPDHIGGDSVDWQPMAYVNRTNRNL